MAKKVVTTGAWHLGYADAMAGRGPASRDLYYRAGYQAGTADRLLAGDAL